MERRIFRYAMRVMLPIGPDRSKTELAARSRGVWCTSSQCRRSTSSFGARIQHVGQMKPDAMTPFGLVPASDDGLAEPRAADGGVAAAAVKGARGGVKGAGAGGGGGVCLPPPALRRPNRGGTVVAVAASGTQRALAASRITSGARGAGSSSMAISSALVGATCRHRVSDDVIFLHFQKECFFF